MPRIPLGSGSCRPVRRAPRLPTRSGPRKFSLPWLAELTYNGAMSDPVQIGERIRAARQERGWTQEQLAEAVGVSRSAVAQWETGRAGQLTGNLSRICRGALGRHRAPHPWAGKAREPAGRHRGRTGPAAAVSRMCAGGSPTAVAHRAPAGQTLTAEAAMRACPFGLAGGQADPTWRRSIKRRPRPRRFRCRTGCGAGWRMRSRTCSAPPCSVATWRPPRTCLGVMESMHARARMRFSSERQGTTLMIGRARKELDSRKARRRTGQG